VKLVVRCVVFAVIVGIIIFALNGIYTVRKTGFINDWSDSFTIAGFYNEPKGSLDVLIFGTSTMNNGVQPAVLWNERGFTAYNRSSEIQSPLAAYYLLTESLKYQQPRVVVLNADWLYMPPLGYPEHLSNAMMHLALDYMKLSDIKIRAVLDIASKCGIQNALNYIFPFYAYHSRQNITKNDFDQSFLSRSHPLKGSSIHLEPASGVPFGMVGAEETDELPEIYRDYMDRMIGLCQSKGIEVLLLTLPLSDWTWGHHVAVQQYADEMGVGFLDMNTPAIMDALALDPDTDFRDPNHPTISGSSKISRYVASYLTENYALGRRDYPEEVAASFDVSYADYMAYSRIFDGVVALKSAVQLSDYLQLLADMEDSIVVISAKNEFSLSLTEQQKATLAALGLKTDFNADIYRYSYAAVLDSGSVVFEQCQPDRIEYGYTSPEGVSVSVVSASAFFGNRSSIVINGTEYSISWQGLNIVAYSKKAGIVTDSVNFNTNAGEDAFRG
jgi:hypothetical protein